jgi:hypothetical protein
MNASPSEHLAMLQKGGLIEVAPGLWRPCKPGDVPEVVLARLESAGNGAYRLVPAGEAWARLDSTTVSALGFPGRWDTLLRLGIAGFIEIVKPAPGTTLLNLASWWGHLRRCAEDPWFWDDPRRRKTYLDACREIQQRPVHKTCRAHRSILS